VSQPLLDLLDGHTTCDFRTGYITALHAVASFLQDYSPTEARGVVAAVQAPLLRAITAAECPTCDLHGHVVDGNGRSIDHHPIGGAA
jgi:hypothetical protein